MRETIKMPRVGETVDEVYLVSWNKSVGDEITIGESLMEVETDKATVEVPSPISGRILELLFKEGDEITTGSDIVICESF
jgi:glutaconyl-CoA/methylmalonyl-CoA decarboxylase subunit gamma